MKKNKIIGAIIALGGVIVSFATAFALFQKTAAPLNVNIGPYTWEGASGDITHTVAAPELTQNKGNVNITPNGYTYSGEVLMNETASFALGGSYAEATNIKHDIIAGKVTVTITVANEFVGVVKTAVYMAGYGEGSQGARDYAGSNLNGSGNTVLSQATTTFTRDVVVSNNGTQKINVYLDFSDLYTSSYMPLADTANAYSVHVQWEGVDSASVLHEDYLPVIRGDYNNWEVGPEYNMLPDINGTADGLKFRFVGHVAGLNSSALTGKTYFEEFKVYFQDTGTWVGASGNNQTNDGSHTLAYITDGDVYYL